MGSGGNIGQDQYLGGNIIAPSSPFLRAQNSINGGSNARAGG